jgi:hypothetical protein
MPALRLRVHLQHDARRLGAFPGKTDVTKLTRLRVLCDRILPAGQLRVEALTGRDRKRADAGKAGLTLIHGACIFPAVIVEMVDEETGVVLEQFDHGRGLVLARIGLPLTRARKQASE